MKSRSTILALLLSLTVLLVLVVVASTYMLVAFVFQDQTVTDVLRWTVAGLTGLAVGNLTLLVIALAVDRVISAADDTDEEMGSERDSWEGGGPSQANEP